MTLNLWWIRRDVRLSDNPALRAALANGADVLPVFILDPHLLRLPSARRQAFLFEGLRRLQEDLRARGSRLLVRVGSPPQVLAELVAESGAQAVFAGADESPYARQRDARAEQAVAAQGARLHWVQEVTLYPPDAVLKPDGQPYIVFTPYRKAWLSLPPPSGTPWQPPSHFAPVPDLPGIALPALDDPAFFVPGQAEEVRAVLRAFPPGEIEAARRFNQFISGPLADYADTRDRLDLDGTSTLSPYLRFGMLSIRQVVMAAMQAARAASDAAARHSAQVWLNELIWREFYVSILAHFPFVLKMAFRPALRGVAWRNDPQDLADWQSGHTGYPLVDACMRQMNATGWMHNRGRMIVASFLTKDLLINWQAGERYFMQQLVDGDPAANNGGWQWSAGTGTDAAPYFRVFNPVLQSKKFDPQAAFIRRWLPELADFPAEWIHEPWRSPQPPAGYPAPLVAHDEARQRVLAAYRQASS